MTVPAHPDCRRLLAQAIATDPAIAHLVARFPDARTGGHLAAVLTLWQALAEHAPACSTLADCWITADAGRDARTVEAVAVSVDHPDPALHVQLVTYLDRGRLTTDPAATGPEAAAATLPVLDAAIADLDTAATQADRPDLLRVPVTVPTHADPVRSAP